MLTTKYLKTTKNFLKKTTQQNITSSRQIITFPDFVFLSSICSLLMDHSFNEYLPTKPLKGYIVGCLQNQITSYIIGKQLLFIEKMHSCLYKKMCYNNI